MMLKSRAIGIILLALLVSVSVSGPLTQAAVKPKPQELLLSVGMTCTPQMIGPNDHVHLTIPMPHGGELSIQTPTGAWEKVIYYLNPRKKSGYVSSIDGPEFKYRDKVDIYINTISTIKYRKQSPNYKRIFTVNGQYQIYISGDYLDRAGRRLQFCDLKYRDPADPRPPPRRIYPSD